MIDAVFGQFGRRIVAEAGHDKMVGQEPEALAEVDVSTGAQVGCHVLDDRR